jgi:hypothetical protein
MRHNILRRQLQEAPVAEIVATGFYAANYPAFKAKMLAIPLLAR